MKWSQRPMTDGAHAALPIPCEGPLLTGTRSEQMWLLCQPGLAGTVPAQRGSWLGVVAGGWALGPEGEAGGGRRRTDCSLLCAIPG